MTRLRAYISTAIVIAGFSFAGATTAMAAPSDSAILTVASPVVSVQTLSRFDKVAQRMISASEAKAIARRRVPGAKYVDMSRNGKIYKVRLQKDGRVIDVLIDATTGRVLN